MPPLLAAAQLKPDVIVKDNDDEDEEEDEEDGEVKEARASLLRLRVAGPFKWGARLSKYFLRAAGISTADL